MTGASVKEMLQAGLHFGHQTRRWNPKMKPYIYGPRNGIYIINLDVTRKMFERACAFVTREVAAGGTILFVGTKRQAQAIIREEAKRCGMFYVDNRWLGGMLTNFQTIKTSVERLKSIESMQADGSINRFPKKEILQMEKERVKLERNVGGIKDMRAHPTVVFIVDPKAEAIAVNEARKLAIPIVAITDTNCDPDGIDYLIPGNDDAIKAIKLITHHVAEAVLEGQALRQVNEEVEQEADAEPDEADAEPDEADAEPDETDAEPDAAEAEAVPETASAEAGSAGAEAEAADAGVEKTTE